MIKIRFPLFFLLFAYASLFFWFWIPHHSQNQLSPALWWGITLFWGVMAFGALRICLFPVWAFDEKGIYRYGFFPGTIYKTFSWSDVQEVGIETDGSSRGPELHHYALFFKGPNNYHLTFFWFLRTRLQDVAQAVRFARAANPQVLVDARILTKLEAPYYTLARWFDLGLYLVEIPVFVGLFAFLEFQKKDNSLATPWVHWLLVLLGAIEAWLLFLLVYKLIHRKDHVDARPKPQDPNVSTWGLSLLRKPGPIFATYFLLILITGVFVCEMVYALDKAQWNQPGSLSLIAFGASGRDFVLGHGQWYRLLSSTLLHLNIDHLLYNAFALYLVGYALEGMVGPRWYFVIFFLSGLCGSLASLYFAPAHSLSVGVSGAIMGLMGASLVVSFKLPKGTARDYIHWLILPSFVLSLVPVFSKGGDPVDISAHAGGALCGVVLALFLYEFWSKDQPLPGLEKMAGFFSVGALAALVWAVYVPAHAYTHNRELAALLLPEKDIPQPYEKAVQQSAGLLARYPHDPRVLNYRASAYLRAGNSTAAEKELQTALGEEEILDGFYAKAFEYGLRLELAGILVHQGRRKEALEAAKPVCESNPEGEMKQTLDKLKLCE